MAKQADEVADFFTKYPSTVADIANGLRVLIRGALPDASETLDEPDRVVGYSIGEGYAGLVCTIILSKQGVKLGIVRGADVPDPKGLLEGPGKRHRYVQFLTAKDLERPGIAALIKAARKAANPTGK